MKPKKGRVPPQLRKFLFKKGKRRSNPRMSRTEKNRRARMRRRGVKLKRKKTVRHSMRHANPMQAGGIRERYVIIAKRGAKTLRYTGDKFSDSRAAVVFGLKAQAVHVAKSLLVQFPILKSWEVYVKPHAGK